jgi:hypothetical protein
MIGISNNQYKNKNQTNAWYLNVFWMNSEFDYFECSYNKITVFAKIFGRNTPLFRFDSSLYGKYTNSKVMLT